MPIKGIHTRASDLRSKSILQSLLQRNRDESDEVKSRFKMTSNMNNINNRLNQSIEY